MVAVNATASSALATLSLIKPRSEPSASLKAASTAAISPTSSLRLSTRVSDAIMKVSQIISTSKLSDLPVGHAEKLKSFGADAATRIEKPHMNEEDFQSTVMAYVKDAWNGLDGFSEALARGSVKIQRANDVEGLGYETVQYNMWKGGGHLGSAGWDTINRDFYDSQAATGIRQGIGSINGQDYYVTW